MLGTILIIDAVSTNRIMLKVQLSAAWYHVVQADRLQGLMPLVRRTRPDLIVTANIGCLMHLQEHEGVPVVHWLNLVADDLSQ